MTTNNLTSQFEKLTWQAPAPRKIQHGGHLKKSDEQHKKDGTWRANRHSDPDAEWKGDPDQFRAALRASDRPRKTVEKYCKDVLDGTVPAGRLVKLAVRRYLWDRKEGKKRGIFFDEGKATEGCEFFPVCLRHSKGKWAGKPFELTPPQMFIFWNVFGFVNDEGLRRFTRAHNEVARKFGKSEGAAGAALKQGTMDDPPDHGAEIYLCATKEEQARTQTFRQCVRMIRHSPFLKQRVKSQAKQLVVHPTDPFQPDSVIRPIGNDSDSSDGFDQSGAILDELHAYQKRHKEFYERMTTAGGAREQELIWVWTTAGNDKSETWLELREIAVRTLESVETGQPVNDHIFAFIACIDEDDDPLSLDIDSDEFLRVMQKANPNMPATPKPSYLRQQARDALNSPIGRNKFMRFHANVRVSSSVQPFPSDLLKKYSEKVHRMPATSMGGFDVGRTDDFASWGITWREADKVRLYSRSYTCAERPEHLQTGQIADWIRDGYLIEHPGNQVDFMAIADDIEKAHAEFNVAKWAMDESFAKLLAQELQRRLGEDTIGKFIQTYQSYNAPCRELQKEFNKGRVSPDEDPALRWQMRNITFKADAKDQWMPDKGIGREYKIDGGISVIMAYALLMFEVTEPTGSSVSVFDPSDEELNEMAHRWQ